MESICSSFSAFDCILGIDYNSLLLVCRPLGCEIYKSWSLYQPVNVSVCFRQRLSLLNLYRSAYNFSAQKLGSTENQHILNFRVTAVLDIKLRTRLSKNICLSGEIQPHQRLKYQQKCLCKCFLLSTDNQSPTQPNLVPDVYTIFRPLVYQGGTPTWRLHTGLCKFEQNIFRRICEVWENAHY